MNALPKLVASRTGSTGTWQPVTFLGADAVARLAGCSPTTGRRSDGGSPTTRSRPAV
jgi:hypothetical protein